MPTPYDQSCCPLCKSDNIEAKEIEIPEFASTFQPVVCRDCGASWNDVYVLVGYDNLVPPPKKA